MLLYPLRISRMQLAFAHASRQNGWSRADQNQQWLQSHQAGGLCWPRTVFSSSGRHGSSTVQGHYAVSHLYRLHRHPRSPPLWLPSSKASPQGSCDTFTDRHQGELNAPQKVITCQGDKLPGYVTLEPPQCIPMNTFQWGMVQSMFTVGGFFGAIFTGAVATSLGRLFAMKWAAAFLAGGPIAEALAGKMWVLAFGRALSGVGAGAATVVCPMYISE